MKKRWFRTTSRRKEMHLSNTLFISGIVACLGLLGNLHAILQLHDCEILLLY